MGKRNVSSLLKRRVAARAKWKCSSCANILDEHYEVDHIVPLWKGGSNQLANLQVLCCKCHKTKTLTENIARGPSASIAVCEHCEKVYSLYFGLCPCTRPEPAISFKASRKRKILE